MVSELLRPILDHTSEWSGPLSGLYDPYTYIDNNVVYPNIAGTSDYLFADAYLGDDNNQVDIFFMDMPTGFLSGNSISSITVSALGQIRNGSTYPEVSVSWDTGDSWSSEIDCTGFGVHPSGSDSGLWHQATWDGLSKNEDDLSKLLMRFRADVPDSDKDTFDINWVYVAYAEVEFLSRFPSTPSGIQGWTSVSGVKKQLLIKR